MTRQHLSPMLISWASIIEPKTAEQAVRTASMPFINPHLALMPDAHLHARRAPSRYLDTLLGPRTSNSAKRLAVATGALERLVEVGEEPLDAPLGCRVSLHLGIPSALTGVIDELRLDVPAVAEHGRVAYPSVGQCHVGRLVAQDRHYGLESRPSTSCGPSVCRNR